MTDKNEFEQSVIKILLSHPEGVQIPYMLSVLQRSQNESIRAFSKEALRKRVYRIMKKWAESGIVKAIKISSRYTIYRLVSAEHIIDLSISLRGRLLLSSFYPLRLTGLIRVYQGRLLGQA